MTKTHPFVTDSSAIGDLRTMFVALARNRPMPSDADLSALRRHVDAAVDEMKQSDMLPEHVVIAVKRLALDSGIQWTNHRLFDRLIDWCLEDYYNTPPNDQG
jgi:hypothetical protein